MAFKPVTYVRGKGEVALAESAARAISLEYDGWTKQPKPPAPKPAADAKVDDKPAK